MGSVDTPAPNLATTSTPQRTLLPAHQEAWQNEEDRWETKKGREGMPKLQVGHKEPKGGMGSSQGQGRCPLGANVGSVDTHTQDLATNPPLP